MTKKQTPKSNKFTLANEKFFNVVKMACAIALALVITFLVVCALSDDPVNAFVTIITGPLRKARYFGVAIEKAIPYCFAGLCCGILFKCGYFNLGCEGIFIVSGLFMSFLATREWLAIPGLHPIICILGAALCGGIFMLIPAFMKTKFDANEMVLSLMLNSAYLGIATYIVKYHFITPKKGLIATPDFLETARINYLPVEFFEKFHITACFFLMIAMVAIVYIVLNKTKLGYQIRLVGANPRFAKYSGVNAFKLAMTSNFIAGCLAGTGAAIQLLTQLKYYEWTGDKTPGIGFSGNLMAMLGQNNPIGIAVSAFCIQYLEEGTTVLYFNDTSVPAEIVAIIEAVIILLVSSQYFLRGLREKELFKQGLGGAHRSDREGN